MFQDLFEASRHHIHLEAPQTEHCQFEQASRGEASKKGFLNQCVRLSHKTCNQTLAPWTKAII